MYEITLRESETSAALATEYLNEGDEYMYIFWAKCAYEYERRAKELTIEEAI